MYGLVNKAVEDLVCSHYGEGTWAQIQARAGVQQPGFVSMESYPDEVTYKLVDAASEVLGAPAAEVLEAVGEHWILFTARHGYGELLPMFGATLREFVVNLDNMHARVGLTFAKLRPPSFVVREAGPQALELEYHSSRRGWRRWWSACSRAWPARSPRTSPSSTSTAASAAASTCSVSNSNRRPPDHAVASARAM
ncbi:heme NO-binding domain-containing protein [Nannocystis pusilla]|uniref:Heme NO-binding domain-containing protein n=1 Tax=Nannocystis pusilla TaxID=889268 RepID=A0A9X3J1K0_9BACT|nr:heme NO-binding domain-containing protein [Nannocystis pusilla]MCY1010784.1 heme NO-binding domain-containing protein [Nannocystis pusilla]